ncbi:biopolymer transporter ExbD [bacterium]|nr:biopolymer transporter ExbD [bacterium]
MSSHDFNEQEDNRIVSEINVTPLVDIMLTILIIFMLVSSFVAKEAIEVDLPHAATGKETERKTLSILVSKEGEYYLSGKKYETASEIGSELKREKNDNPQIQVVISADRLVYHGKVVDIIDLIRQLEIYDFAINVEYDEEALKNSQ